MLVKIAAGGLKLSGDLLEYIRRQVQRRLGRIGGSLEGVLVALSDVNGPKGGDDKRCRIVLEMPGQPQLVAQAIDGNSYAAVNGSLIKLQRQLLRQQRLRQGRRR